MVHSKNPIVRLSMYITCTTCTILPIGSGLLDANQLAAHGIGVSSPIQQKATSLQLDHRQPSPMEDGSPIDNNLRSVVTSPMVMASRKEVDQHRDVNEIGRETEDADDDAFAVQPQNQDGGQVDGDMPRSIVSIGALARKTFVERPRLALSRHFNLPTQHEQEQRPIRSCLRLITLPCTPYQSPCKRSNT